MIQMLYTGDSYVFVLGGLVCLVLGNEDAPLRPSVDLFAFIMLAGVSKYLEEMHMYLLPKDYQFDRYVAGLSVLYQLLDDNAKALLFAAWLPYDYMRGNPDKFWLYIAFAVSLFLYQHLGRLRQFVWPRLPVIFYDSMLPHYSQL
jgi:hypothetical protein